MTTYTEAPRAKFEAWATAEYRLSFDNDTPLKHYLWAAFQAGHAAAKAETATVGAPMAMVQCHGSAEHPLYTADQLAAAVAAEREKCAGIVNELRMESARRNMPESATMLWHAEDAIRAGEKEPSDAA